MFPQGFKGKITADEREMLYNKIWAEPVKVVAKAYGISDVALRKYCIKFGIPLPPRGYWEKVRAGKIVHQTPLPKVIGELTKHVRNYVIRYKNDIEQLSDKELKEGDSLFLLTQETQFYIQDVISRLEVKKQLKNPHPLITDHKEELLYRRKRDKEIGKESFNTFYQNRVRSQYRDNKPILPIDVSVNQLNRAYRIMDALIKILLELEGYVSVGHVDKRDSGSLVVMNVSFRFELTEKTVKRHYQKKVHEMSRKNVKRDAEGDLILRLSPTVLARSMEQELEFKDDGSKPLEDMLGSVVMQMFILANKVCANDELYRRDLDRRIEEGRRQRRIQESIIREKEKVQELQKVIFDWDLAQKIRQFADYIEIKNASIIDKDEHTKISQFVDWARERADWLDPLVTREDELLENRPNILEIIRRLQI